MSGDPNHPENYFEALLDRTRGGLLDGDLPCRDATIWVHDTMEFAWASARQLFGEAARPEHAFSIYDRIVQRLEEP